MRSENRPGAPCRFTATELAEIRAVHANKRKASRLVKDTCAKYEIDHHEFSQYALGRYNGRKPKPE
jgi:hypothetical protein